MKTEVKSAAILIATLALGMVLGMVAQGVLMRARTEQVGGLRRPPGFTAHLEAVIQPRPEQREAVRAILETTARRNQDIMSRAREDLRRVLDSMQLQLAPQLDDPQRERLARMSRLPDPFRPPPPGEGRPGGPPPRGPPPDAGGGRPPPPI